MELLKSVGHRTRFSELIYFILNLSLPIVLLILVRAFDSVSIGIILLLLSKWRVLAVRPRYWFMNIKSNLVDVGVGVSYVLLLFVAQDSLLVQIALSVLFVVWLIVLKPKSKRHFVSLQAGIGQVVSLATLFMFSYQLDVVTVVVLSWLIGYAAARHALSAYEEEHLEAIALCWGLAVAELSWLAYHWTLSYQLVGGIAVPQIAAIIAVISFTGYNLYDDSVHERPNPRRVRLSVGVCVLLLAIIMFFSRWNVAI